MSTDLNALKVSYSPNIDNAETASLTARILFKCSRSHSLVNMSVNLHPRTFYDLPIRSLRRNSFTCIAPRSSFSNKIQMSHSNSEDCSDIPNENAEDQERVFSESGLPRSSGDCSSEYKTIANKPIVQPPRIHGLSFGEAIILLSSYGFVKYAHYQEDDLSFFMNFEDDFRENSSEREEYKQQGSRSENPRKFGRKNCSE